MEDAPMTPHTALVGPGWRELLETLHSETEALRAALTASAEREAALLALLHAERAMDRESRLLTLLEADRAELQCLRPPSPPHPGPPIPGSRQTNEVHGRIVEALEASGNGMTAKQLEAALGTSRPLADILSHLVRKRRLVRLGQGRVGLPVEVLMGAPALNGTGP